MAQTAGDQSTSSWSNNAAAIIPLQQPTADNDAAAKTTTSPGGISKQPSELNNAVNLMAKKNSQQFATTQLVSKGQLAPNSIISNSNDGGGNTNNNNRDPNSVTQQS